MKLTEIKTGQYVDLTKVEAIKLDYNNSTKEYAVTVYLASGKFLSSKHLEERSAVMEQVRLVELVDNAK